MILKKDALKVGLVLVLMLGTNLMAKQTIQEMEIKLANLRVDISQNKVNLFQREEKMYELGVKALSSTKIDEEKMELKLAEIEFGIAEDKLLLFKRELKLHEMEVALLKAKHH